MRCILIISITVCLLLSSTCNGYYMKSWDDSYTQGTDYFQTDGFFGDSDYSQSQYSSQPQEYSYPTIDSFDDYNQHHHHHHQQPVVDDITPDITKNFYFHVAPEAEPVKRITKEIILGRPTQNYKVIFVKPPAEPKKIINIKAVYPRNDEKTIVYVLNKNPEDVEIEGVLTQPDRHVSLPPEVFFLKYDSHDQATKLQQQIQAQYDFLGGSSQVHDVEEARTISGTLENVNNTSNNTTATATASASAVGGEQNASDGDVSVGDITAPTTTSSVTENECNKKCDEKQQKSDK